MHQYIRIQLAGLAPSRSRPCHAGCHLIRALFRGVSSSTLGSYHSLAGLRMTRRNVTSLCIFWWSIILRNTQRLDWVAACSFGIRRENGWSRDAHDSCLAPSSYMLSSLGVCSHGRSPTTLSHTDVSHNLAPESLTHPRGMPCTRIQTWRSKSTNNRLSRS
jgi:hypothetical protein